MRIHMFCERLCKINWDRHLDPDVLREVMENRLPSDWGMSRGNETGGSLFDRLPKSRPGSPAGAASPTSPARAGLLVVMWRGRWVTLLCVVASIAAGLMYIRTAAPIYVSTAKLYLDYAGIRIANPFDPGSVPKTDKYLNTQAGLISSKTILGSAIEALTPQHLKTFSDVGLPTAYVQKNMSVHVGKRDEIITISFRSPHSYEAAAIVNSIVEAYMMSRTEHGQRNFAQLSKFLQDNMDRAGQERDEKRKALAEFRKSGMPLSLGSQQAGGILQRYQALLAARTQAQIVTMQAETLRTAVRRLSDDPAALRQYLRLSGNAGVSIGADPEKAPLENRLVALEQEREDRQKTLTPDHPQIAGLTGEMERIRGRLKKLDERFVGLVRAAVEQRYADAKECEERLVALCGEEAARVVMLNAEVEQYQWLQSEVTALAAHYAGLEEEVRAISKIMGEDDGGQLRMEILELASAAQVPSEPEKEKVMAVALVLGLLLGGGIALTRDQLDQTIHSAEEIPSLLGLPVLGAVPAMSRRKKIRDRGRTVLLRPDSREAEAFRTIQTAVFFGAPQDHARTILITSPAPGDGKSTLVSNLAIAMARVGQKTLVLDADFRRPMQHTIFGLDQHERCLCSVFAGEMELSAAIQATDPDGPHLLTYGRGISNPAEVLNGRQFASLLERLVEMYDRVLIDAPPVTVVTDALIIGALCDVTVVVLKAEKSTRRVARRTIDALQGVGARVLGMVVNEIRRNDEWYGYRYHQYYRPTDADSRNGGRDKSPVRVARGSETEERTG